MISEVIEQVKGQESEAKTTWNRLFPHGFGGMHSVEAMTSSKAIT